MRVKEYIYIGKLLNMRDTPTISYFNSNFSPELLMRQSLYAESFNASVNLSRSKLIDPFVSFSK